MGQLDDLPAERRVQLARHRPVAITVSGEPHKPTRAPLRHLMLFDQLANGFAFGLRG
jgi:hypothetical protein